MAEFQIRPALPEDTAAVFSLIQALSVYEKLAHEVTGSEDLLHRYLFGPEALAEVLVVELPQHPEPVGFALYFRNFSTFLTKPGIYLEDLFVQPEFRGRGIGKALLIRLAQIVLERDYGRLEWAVLDWNEPAIQFYQRIGAKQRPEWILNRVTGSDLTYLAGLEGS